MINALKNLERDAQNEITLLTDPKLLLAAKVKYLGRKGLFASISSRISEIPGDQKREAGQEMNRVKTILEELFSSREKALLSGGEASAQRLDATMPGTDGPAGSLHPLSRVIFDISEIFTRLGFSVVDGPEVETEYYNFEALNIPLNHPARDSFDTFYLDDGKLLRSQTSTVQIRVMQKRKPPLRIVAPGRVYRPDPVDASHSFMFHQIEGLMVDENITFSDLKGVLLLFLRELFGSDTKVRFRPHFFPFTEPSVEVDIKWGKGWLEILGAGTVHPNVFQAVGYDSKRIEGFAFGLGVERIAMLRHAVPDIRLFYENDLRFLRQF